MRRGEFGQFVSESLVIKSRLSEKVVSQYPGLLQTALAIFPGNGGKGGNLAVSDGSIMQGKSYEGILRHLELARCDDEWIGDGKIQ